MAAGYKLILLVVTVWLLLLHSGTAEAQQEWVVVLDDPRPERLRGWERDDYTSTRDYSGALELKRLARRLAKRHNLEVVQQWYIESLNVYCLIANFKGDHSATLRNLRTDKAVEYVQPSNRFTLLQQHKGAAAARYSLITPPELRLPSSIDGTGVLVALVDSFVDDQHHDLSHGIQENINFVNDLDSGEEGDRNGLRKPAPEPHGTAMAGVIIADTKSDLGVTGLAPGARLNAYRGCWETEVADSPNCSTLTLARALDAAIMSKADIVNISLSGPKDELLDQLISEAVSGGATVVTAFDPKRSSAARFPSFQAGVFTVKAESTDGIHHTTLMAPGSKVVAFPGQRADFVQGHSVASAYMAGVLALCKQIEVSKTKKICTATLFEQLQLSGRNNVEGLVSTMERELALPLRRE